MPPYLLRCNLSSSLCNLMRRVSPLVLHAQYCFVWGVSLTRPILFCVGSFSYTPRAVLCGEFLLHNTPQDVLCSKLLFHAPCCFMWGVSLTCLMLCYVGNFLHAPGCFMWGVSLTRSVLCYVGSFSYTPCAVLRGEFPIHNPSCFMWGVSLVCLVLYNDGIYSYTPHAV